MPCANSFLGRGVTARTNGDEILVGNDRFMGDQGIGVSYFKTKAKKRIAQGHTVLYVARNGKLQGVIVVANAVRPNARARVGLASKGRGVIPLYGDRRYKTGGGKSGAFHGL